MSTTALERPANDLGARLRLTAQVCATMFVMSVGALAMLLVAALTGFRLRRFYSERMATPLGRIVLAIFGVRYVVRRGSEVPRGQVVYISNHTSTIDMFVLIALGLPNTRFFLSGYLRKLVPLGIIGTLIGIFWTVLQDRPQERRRIFARAAQVLKRTRESVYLSPEGERITSGRIGHFNKGAFHLATDLQAPIVPMFLWIPPVMDPGKGLAARAGTVEVHFGETIDTSGWRIEDVERNRDAVRALYERWHAELYAH